MKYPIGKRLLVKFSNENADYYGLPRGTEFSAKVSDYQYADYLVEDMDSDFFTVSEAELSELESE